MRAVRVHKFGGGPQDLVYEENVMQPHPKEGELLVKVYATGVTPNEINWIWYHPDISLPIILGHELSGIVEEVDSKVTNQRVGEAVYGLTDTLSFTRDGAEAEYVIAIDSEMAPKPQSLDHEHAAAVPMAGLTAWPALFDHAHLSSKDTILIHGAAGGVGSFAVQLARWAGAHVIGTASANNSIFLKGLGVNDVIDYKKTSFEDRVYNVDVVFDTILPLSQASQAYRGAEGVHKHGKIVLRVR